MYKLIGITELFDESLCPSEELGFVKMSIDKAWVTCNKSKGSTELLALIKMLELAQKSMLEKKKPYNILSEFWRKYEDFKIGELTLSGDYLYVGNSIALDKISDQVGKENCRLFELSFRNDVILKVKKNSKLGNSNKQDENIEFLEGILEIRSSNVEIEFYFENFEIIYLKDLDLSDYWIQLRKRYYRTVND